MLIEECSLPKSNQLVEDYISGNKKAKIFFDYDYKDIQSYFDRKRELQEYHFPREALAEHLKQFNQQFTTHPKVFENIDKLRLKESAVVITGQQAGFLTGPLYTIYKAMSAIQYAEQLEAKLQIPVVPVFWVAGEDHDFQEINHVWILKESKLEKQIYHDVYNDRKPVSTLEINDEKFKQWLNQVFYFFGETEYSRTVMHNLQNKLQISHTVVEFFIHIMSDFFEKYGLIFVDSADENLRKIEAPFFHQMVQKNDVLRKTLQEQREQIVKNGYPSAIDTERDCAHLFYHYEGERHLLFYCNGSYALKDRDIIFTENELQLICENSPEKLSNNVVTRPLMQEYLFPTLAFVAGPGEITYWAQLKSMFASFGKKMPPIVPRMHATIVERNVSKWLDTFNLSLQEVVTYGVSRYRDEWFEKQKNEKAESVFNETKQMIDLAHAKLRKLAWEIDHNLGQISEKNRLLILQQLHYMERRMQKMYEERHEKELEIFYQMEARLVPNGGLQERTWNIFYFLNKYGIDFIDRLCVEHQLGHAKHHIVYV